MLQPGNTLVDIGGQVIRVVRLTARQGECHMRQQRITVLAMIDFRMDHDGVDAGCANQRMLTVRCVGEHVPSGGERADLVVVIHHYSAPSICTKRLGDLYLHFAELWDGCCRHLATKLDREHLGAITDAQDDTVLYKSGQITLCNSRGILVGYAVVTAREDDELGMITTRGHGWDIRGVNNPTAQTNVTQQLRNHGCRFRAKMYDQHLRIVSCTPGESLDMPRRLHTVLPLAFSLIMAPVWYTACAITRAM